MGWLRWLGISVISMGVVLFAYGIYLGQIDVFLVLIFPVLIGTGAVGGVALLLIFFGVMALVLSFFSLAEGTETPGADGSGPDEIDAKSSGKFGGVVLIGPVPIIFGSDRRTALMAAGLGLLVLAVLVTLLLL